MKLDKKFFFFFLLALSKHALITVAPSLVADTDARLPRNEPIGVRTALTITTSYY
jgi:hypothetical protein